MFTVLYPEESGFLLMKRLSGHSILGRTDKRTFHHMVLLERLDIKYGRHILPADFNIFGVY